MENNPAQNAHRMLFVTTIPLTLTAFLLPLAEHLQAQGWFVGCAAAGATTWPGLEAFDARADIRWSRSLRSFFAYPRLAREIRALVTAGAYDTVHVHTPIAAFITRCALRSLRAAGVVRIIYTAHGFHFYHGASGLLRNRLFHRMEQRAARWTDVLVVMNDEDERAGRTLVASAPSCTLVRIDGIGYDFARVAAVRQMRETCAAKCTDAPVHLLMIAEMNANKRHSLLLDALERVERSNPGSWDLTLCGDGPLRSALEARIATGPLAERVTCTGQLDRAALDARIAAADLGLLVSEREGLPRSLMELCAAGVCIAGTRTRGIVDEVADDRALATADPAVLAALLERLITDAPLRAELARAQYARARARYDLPVILERYDRVWGSGA